MLIQIKNQILKVESISFAEITFPDADSDNDWIELRLIVDGAVVVLSSEDALTTWHYLQRNATSLQPVTLNGHRPTEPITVAGFDL